VITHDLQSYAGLEGALRMYEADGQALIAVTSESPSPGEPLPGPNPEDEPSPVPQPHPPVKKLKRAPHAIE
jgi:hypothetical protein